MSDPRLRGLLPGLLLLPALLAPVSVQADSKVAAPQAVEEPAPSGRMDALYRETGAVRELPDPGWARYGRLLSERVAEWMSSWMRPLVPSAGLIVRGMGYGILALTLATLAVLLWRFAQGLSTSRRRTGRRSVPDLAPASSEHDPRPDTPWRRRIDEHLARGNVESALEAVWWWLAVSTVDRSIQTSWTSRELLEAAGRSDLRPEARALDRMMYGPARPTAGDVQRLVGGLEPRLA